MTSSSASFFWEQHSILMLGIFRNDHHECVINKYFVLGTLSFSQNSPIWASVVRSWFHGALWLSGQTCLRNNGCLSHGDSYVGSKWKDTKFQKEYLLILSHHYLLQKNKTELVFQRDHIHRGAWYWRGIPWKIQEVSLWAWVWVTGKSQPAPPSRRRGWGRALVLWERRQLPIARKELWREAGWAWWWTILGTKPMVILSPDTKTVWVGSGSQQVHSYSRRDPTGHGDCCGPGEGYKSRG